MLVNSLFPVLLVPKTLLDDDCGTVKRFLDREWDRMQNPEKYPAPRVAIRVPRYRPTVIERMGCRLRPRLASWMKP